MSEAVEDAVLPCFRVVERFAFGNVVEEVSQIKSISRKIRSGEDLLVGLFRIFRQLSLAYLAYFLIS